MHGKGRGHKTVAGLLTSLGLAVPVAALPACETTNPAPGLDTPGDTGIRWDAVATENPAPDIGFRYDTPDAPIGTENPPAPFDVDEEDAGADDAGDEDASSDDAGDEDAGTAK